jgi:hypothetical protein
MAKIELFGCLFRKSIAACATVESTFSLSPLFVMTESDISPE